MGGGMAGMLSLPGSACLLSTTVILVDGCPGTTLYGGQSLI
jgi:hypothetical protein